MGIGVKLQRLKTEDLIWVIYFFIALAALISDSYERDYVLTNNINDKKMFKTINIIILTIALFIYIYFVLINYEDVSHLRREATKKEVAISHLGLVAALLFLSAGVISIFVELNRDQGLEDIELL